MTLRPRLGLTILLTAIPLVGALLWLRKDVERRSIEDGLREFAVAYMEKERSDCEEAPGTWGGAALDERRPPREGRPDGPPRRGPGRRGPELGPDDERNGEWGPGRRGPGRRGPGGRRPERRPRTGPPPPPRGVTTLPEQRNWVWAYGPQLTSSNAIAPKLPDAYVKGMRDGEAISGGTFRHNGWDGYEVLVRMSWDSGPCAFVLVRRYGARLAGSSPEFIYAAIILCGVLLLAVLFAAAPIVRRIRRLQDDVLQAAANRYATPIDLSGDDEISSLASAFNEAGVELRAHMEQIEQREESLRQFVANTTHDVMIPLTVLQGDLSRVRKALDDGEAVEREAVVQALEESHYMGSLLHNLSAVSKLEGGGYRVRRDPVDINALVSRAAGRHRPMAAARGIELEFGVPEETLHIIGDVTLIEQAVSNLIHNAVRYNERGGHVAVILETPHGNPDRFFVTVVDDGPGIPPEELAKLPQRRFRGEMARQRHPGGLGLGLHITRDVARRHGFDLVFRASSYGGLEVELSGPVLKNGKPEGKTV